MVHKQKKIRGSDLGGGCRGCALHSHPPEMKPSSYLLLKICLPHWSVTSFLRGAPPPKKNPGSAPEDYRHKNFVFLNHGNKQIRYSFK